jgi:hypothetical protein
MPPYPLAILTARLSCAALVAGILAVLAGALAAHAQPAVPDGLPFLVNTVTDGTQDVPDVSTAGSGFVIVWESDAEFNDAIVGQRYDENSNRVGNQFPVSVSTRSQRLPRVAPAADGGFVVVWQDSDGDNILGRRFDAQGNATGHPSQVNLYSEREQEFPAIASDAEGNIVVVYESFKWPIDNDGDAIVGSLFSAVGTRIGTEFLVNTVRSGDQQDPAVGRQPGGGFLVAWESDDANNTGIFAQVFDANGDDVGDQFLVNGIQENNQEFAAVGAWSGGYVVAWESFPDFEGRGIFARRFDSNGIPLGDQFLVNNIQDRDQRFPSVSVFDGGEFVIAWEDDDLGAIAREYGADGNPLANQFLVSASDAFQREPRVAVRDGGFVITWFGGGAEIDDDILGRNYVVPEPGATALGLAALSTLAGLARSRRSRS